MNLKVEKITVKRGNKKIIDDVSLRVNDREFVGIIGPNGCGKSTLLKTIYKYIKPDEGKVLLDNRDILNESPKTVFKDIAVVGQFNEINFNFTVYDIVLMGRSPHKNFLESDNDTDREIVIKALKDVGMIKYKYRDFLSLSGGEKQRVILARALAQKPKLLMLDEPTNHLDIRYQLEILNIVKSLKVGTLSVLHDLSLSAKFCDYIYVIKDGKIFTEGKPIDVITKDTIKEIYNIDSDIIINSRTNDIAISYNL